LGERQSVPEIINPEERSICESKAEEEKSLLLASKIEMKHKVGQLDNSALSALQNKNGIDLSYNNQLPNKLDQTETNSYRIDYESKLLFYV
jgi:hypothetical protein